MKKIITGKRYNTESARQIATWSNGYYASDFSYRSEDLYQKRTGEYFLHGEGGPMSKYATAQGDNRGWGYEIMPMTVAQAKTWAEEHMSAEDYEKEFEVAEESTSPVGAKIQILRESRNWTQTELAEKVGTSQQKIAMYENGQDMATKRLTEICNALEVTLSEFFK